MCGNCMNITIASFYYKEIIWLLTNIDGKGKYTLMDP